MGRKKKKEKNSEATKPILDLARETKKGIWAVFFSGLAIVIILSFWHQAGVFGEYVYSSFNYLFGWGYIVLPLIFILIAFEFLRSERQYLYFTTLFGASIFFVSLLALFELFWNQNKPGGVIGLGVALALKSAFGFWASLILLFAFMVISILVILNLPLKIRPKSKEEPQNLQEVKVNIPQSMNGTQAISAVKVAEKIMPQTRKEANQEEEFRPLKFVTQDYKPLPLELLEREETRPGAGDIKASANIIKRTLENFSISVEMGEVNVGPTVTQYTLKPAQGMKLAKIVALQNDLSLALAAHPLRIEAPIPGKALVGIEVPNRSIALVRLGNLIGSEEFLKSSKSLSMVLGRDVSGEAVFGDLGKMPHLLIAGATGSGKSVCLHNLVTSLVWRNSPTQLKFIFIDPKRVELSHYNKIPHLLTPVIHDGKRAVNALKWAVKEMEKRYELLSSQGVRDIAGFNDKILKNKNAEEKPLPYIVIMIDELADLMAAHSREVEAMIIRIAQMARAIGIHLIVSTQRPSVEVITGLIKANITTRVAFQVASQVDSRTILDMSGAEKLLGSGDMLFLSGDASKPKRIQAAFITEKEVNRVSDYLKKLNIAEQADDAEEDGLDLDRPKEAAASSIDFDLDTSDGVSEDELYEEAKEIVFEAKKASASLLQRRLRVGYARAARLLDILEARGIVGPGDGAKPREVYAPEDSNS